MSIPLQLKPSQSNIEKALSQLEQFIAESSGKKIEKAGIIQAFEFSYETFWAFFQKLAAHNGISAPMPRLAISFALQLGLVQNEILWLQLTKDRNRTSPSYNEEVASEIHDSIVRSYAPEMLQTLQAIRALKWS